MNLQNDAGAVTENSENLDKSIQKKTIFGYGDQSNVSEGKSTDNQN